MSFVFSLCFQLGSDFYIVVGFAIRPRKEESKKRKPTFSLRRPRPTFGQTQSSALGVERNLILSLEEKQFIKSSSLSTLAEAIRLQWTPNTRMDSGKQEIFLIEIINFAFQASAWADSTARKFHVLSAPCLIVNRRRKIFAKTCTQPGIVWWLRRGFEKIIV